MSRVFAIRPEPGFASTVSAGRAMGLDMGGEPLFEVVPNSWDAPDPADFDGLLLGSANAVRHAGRALEEWRGKSAYVVGATTGEAARAAGLEVVAIGEGGLQSLLDTLDVPLRLLRLAGAKRVKLAPPDGIAIEMRTVYRSEPRTISEELTASLRQGAIVLLHSAEAARHFAAECSRLDQDRSGISLAALGPRIAAAAGEGWRSVTCAERPTDAALLELAREMCK